jgi:hypothetical protein
MNKRTCHPHEQSRYQGDDAVSHDFLQIVRVCPAGAKSSVVDVLMIKVIILFLSYNLPLPGVVQMPGSFAGIFAKPSTLLVFSAMFVLTLVTAPPPGEAASEGDPVLASPQPAALKPGLKVHYYNNLFRTGEEVQSWAKARDGYPGEPLHSLDYRSGVDKVLTSSQEDGVGAHITGFIRFEEAGTYAIAAQSNDGLDVEIGGRTVVYDPDVHADRYSQPVEIEIKAPGWYPLDAWYFERKNTSTLRLYWLTPDEEEGSMAIIPKEAYGH